MQVPGLAEETGRLGCYREAAPKSSVFTLIHRCNLQQPSPLPTASGKAHTPPPPEPRSPPYGQICATSRSPAEAPGRPHPASAISLGIGGRERPLDYSSHHPQRAVCENSFSSRWVLAWAPAWAAARLGGRRGSLPPRPARNPGRPGEKAARGAEPGVTQGATDRQAKKAARPGGHRSTRAGRALRHAGGAPGASRLPRRGASPFGKKKLHFPRYPAVRPPDIKGRPDTLAQRARKSEAVLQVSGRAGQPPPLPPRALHRRRGAFSLAGRGVEGVAAFAGLSGGLR